MKNGPFPNSVLIHLRGLRGDKIGSLPLSLPRWRVEGQISQERIVATMLQIAALRLVAVCLALETDVVVCLAGIAAFDETDAPLHHIPQIEPHDEQFEHLSGVYMLVSELGRREGHLGEDDAQEVDGPVGTERYEMVVDYHAWGVSRVC